MPGPMADRKSTRLNSSHMSISYAVFCLNDTASTEIYTLSLHDALPIYEHDVESRVDRKVKRGVLTGIPGLDEQFYGFQPGNLIFYLGRAKAGKTSFALLSALNAWSDGRSEEHTSELQSHVNLVCRLLLE